MSQIIPLADPSTSVRPSNLQVIYTRLKRSQSVLSSLSSSMVAAAAVAAAAEQMEMKQSASNNTDFSAIEDDDDEEMDEGLVERVAREAIQLAF